MQSDNSATCGLYCIAFTEYMIAEYISTTYNF